ncbi:hypothetical protein VY88_18665 [Azospirillum thiophilum]|uniref:Uncharacterized protein n=1 Tax=Azospirillum thiophilum TaxID=528244 RepID=A0AAC8ZVM5_9PROT|nr:hypothetical protein [Azospirillum thiophilum]ALG74108.1 hypothetical protein AL072_24255 [Azospirillum thiophilum]KJR63552.1 hypothetical protein VY88_18665 [Azospirillum thiophilum]
MADDALSSVSSMVSNLNASINNAVEAIRKSQSNQAIGEVQTFEKSVNKSALTTTGGATDIGVLAKNATRLNVASTLAPNDKVDFYKFKVTTKGEMTLGQVGDDGVRVQLMNRLGRVMADSDPKAGDEYDSFKKLQAGNLTVDKGDYTLRVTRDKGQSDKDPKNYAMQVVMGNYSKDYDTVAKQPAKGSTGLTLTTGQQATLDGLNSAIGTMNSIPTGQTGTQKLMGSFSLFV